MKNSHNSIETPRLNGRVLHMKEQILEEIAKGYKPSEVARILDFDTRTIKKALALWKIEDAALALEKAGYNNGTVNEESGNDL